MNHMLFLSSQIHKFFNIHILYYKLNSIINKIRFLSFEFSSFLRKKIYSLTFGCTPFQAYTNLTCLMKTAQVFMLQIFYQDVYIMNIEKVNFLNYSIIYLVSGLNDLKNLTSPIQDE